MRFKLAGYELPKPLIDVAGKPMIERVIDNLDCLPRSYTNPVRWVFVCREPEVYRKLWELVPGCYVVTCDVTEGAACTCLLARHRCPDDEPLLIANCDQLVDLLNLGPFTRIEEDAGILTMNREDDLRWSYVQTDGELQITKVAEKKQISNRATCGIYWFKKAGDFFDAVNRMVAANDRVNGEFYVAPAINYLISDGKYVREYPIELFGGTFHGLGTPEDLETYLNRSK